ATITPSDGYPLVINKVDAQYPDTVIDDPDSRFRILNDAGDVVVEEAFVQDGALRVLDEDGAVKIVTVTETGTYTVEETTAPGGYLQATAPITVTVGEDGSSDAVLFPNYQHTYAVGDY